MSIPNLLKVEWGNHVPSIDGAIDGADLHNLSDIAKSALKDNPAIQRKCWNFATLQDSGIKTYAAGKILKESDIKGRYESIAFSDGKKDVDLYKLAALKKDYPLFKIGNLKNIRAEQFDEIIRFLYEGAKAEDALILMSSIGIYDYALKLKAIGVNTRELANSPLEQLPRILQALLDKYPKIPDDPNEARNLQDAFWLINSRIYRLEPKNREHIKICSELYKILKNNDEIEILKSQKKLVNSMGDGFSQFYNASLNHWFDVDREFIINVVRGLPDLNLTITQETQESLINELRSLPNLSKETHDSLARFSLTANIEKLDWGYGVPTLNGTFDGFSMQNLKTIARSELIQNPVIQKKSWNFATLQLDGKRTYQVGKILSDANVKAAKERVIFENGDRQEVDTYKLAALKKDFSDFKLENLKNLSFDDFNQLINFLYDDSDEEIKKAAADRILGLLNKIGIDDIALKIKYKNELPYEQFRAFAEKCTATQLPRLLDALISFAENNYVEGKTKLDKDTNAYLFSAFGDIDHRVVFSNPFKKEDVIGCLEIFRMTRYLEGAFLDVRLEHLGNQNQFMIPHAEKVLKESFEVSNEPGYVSNLLQKLVTFLSISLHTWFDTDRKFILDAFKGLPHVELKIDRDISREMIDELAKLDNINKLEVSSDVSEECKKRMREKGFKNYSENKYFDFNSIFLR